MEFEKQHEAFRLRCEAAIEKAAGRLFQPNSQVSEAARYSLLSGGKRVRGVLVLAVCEMLDGDSRAADAFSAAIEMVHAFSLVHDDLPCMDDDDMRRGKPAAHVAYGEANALLAGDALAIQAFEALADEAVGPEMGMRAVRALAGAAGARGMIYGQELDMFYEKSPADLEALQRLHRHKTGALIAAAVQLGMISANLPDAMAGPLLKFAGTVGLVFQIVDDLLDVNADEAVLGKPVGSDQKQGKTTFASLLGPQDARMEAESLTNDAVAGLWEAYGGKAAFLCGYAQNLAQRLY